MQNTKNPTQVICIILTIYAKKEYMFGSKGQSSMTTTNKIQQLCTELNIELMHTALPASVHGFYYSEWQESHIVVDENIEVGSALYRSLLAEELGHYFTTIGNRAPVKFITYAERIEYDRTELRAIRRASNFLIKTDSLLEAFRSGSIKHFADIQNHFEVTQALAKE